MKLERRNQYQMNKYRDTIGLCCNPDCDYGLGLECHHIIPLSQGGKDEESNYIVLCRECHDLPEIHNYSLPLLQRLLTYKIYIDSFKLRPCLRDLQQIRVISPAQADELPDKRIIENYNNTKHTDLRSQTLYMGTRVLPRIKEAVEKEIPARWPSTSAFVQEAIAEKLKKENIPVP